MTPEQQTFAPLQSLSRLTSILGDVYGSSEICHFLYSIVKMHRPRTVVELGAGLGVSTFWMSLALRENGAGHLWAVDDFSRYDLYRERFFAQVQPALDELGICLAPDHAPEEYFRAAGALIEVEESLTLVQRSIDLEERDHFRDYPFADREVDLLFSDFASQPRALLQQFVHLLPRMAECSSMFLDSVPCLWESYTLLNGLVDSFNRGRIPKTLAELLPDDDAATILSRAYTLVHLTYNPEGHQCGTSWLKIEPHDFVPYPRVPFRTRPEPDLG